jgi:hypothetical protein
LIVRRKAYQVYYNNKHIKWNQRFERQEWDGMEVLSVRSDIMVIHEAVRDPVAIVGNVVLVDLAIGLGFLDDANQLVLLVARARCALAYQSSGPNPSGQDFRDRLFGDVVSESIF